MNTSTLVRTVTVTGIAAGLALGMAVPASAYSSPQQRIYTLGETPQCLGGTVDVSVQHGYADNEIRANFTTHLYSPAWSGSADYECFLTIDAAWRNHETGDSGTVAHRVASWRFQGPNVADPYVDIVTGRGPVTVTFSTNTLHAPSPTFEVPGR